MRYEYTVVPAPNRGDKAKDAKTPTDRYALTMAGELNRMAAEGWEYLRAETLPSDERSGLTGRATVYHNLLVFRRALAALDEPDAPAVSARPQPEYPVGATPPAAPEPKPVLPEAAAPQKRDDSTDPARTGAAAAVGKGSADAAPSSDEDQHQATPPKPREPKDQG